MKKIRIIILILVSLVMISCESHSKDEYVTIIVNKTDTMQVKAELPLELYKICNHQYDLVDENGERVAIDVHTFSIIKREQ